MQYEKAMAAALEPIVNEILDLEKRLNNISFIEGPAGKDADPVDVDALASVLVEKHIDALRGERGEDAIAPSVDDIVAVMMEKHADDLRGKDGQGAQEINAHDVASVLLKSEEIDIMVTKAAEGLLEKQNQLAIAEIEETFS